MTEMKDIGGNGVENSVFSMDETVSDTKDTTETGAQLSRRKVSYSADTTNKEKPSKIEIPEGVLEAVNDKLLYKTSETPPIHLLFFFGFQQVLLGISGSLALVLIASEVICAKDNQAFQSNLLSSTLFMNGVSTLLMVLVGVRLPLYQGAYGGYLIPLLTLNTIDPGRCDVKYPANYTASANGTSFDIEGAKMDIILKNMREIQGCLMLCGLLHMLTGATGLIGVLLRFVGPVTVVPTILLLGIYVADPILTFCVPHWGITFLVCAVGFLLAFYLAKYRMPIPVWTPSGGCRIVHYPVHQVFAILISIIIGWIVSLIITEAGGFTDDVKHKEYKARTDARLGGISDANWVFFPYPGLYGMVSYATPVFIGFIIATFISILDSIGDYYACAAMSHVPPPPKHAVNRGIFMEGLSTIISGAVGCPQATTTYGGNIGAIGVTRVASISVFVVVGIVYIIFGIFGKLSAVFISIPYPVLGGALIIMLGMFIGVVLSNLQPVDLSSSRNLAIIGCSVLVGLIIPLWIKKYPGDIDTGDAEADFILKGLLGNPNFIGGVLACFLDNTVPGTMKERGIAAWQTDEEKDLTKESSVKYEEGPEIYEIPLPKKIKNWSGWRYIPFMPDPRPQKRERSLSGQWSRRKSIVVGVGNGVP